LTLHGDVMHSSLLDANVGVSLDLPGMQANILQYVPGPSISVVVPVYNSEGSLPILVDDLRTVLEAITCDFEVILVNDGSRDRSWQIVCELAERYEFVRGINLMRNYGQHNALLAGIREARCDVIVTMDDDLQHPPDEIPALLAKLADGYDVVYGVPQREQHGLWRDLASQITKIALQNAMGAETARNLSAFRVFRTQLRDAFASYQGSYVSIDVLLTWGTTRFSMTKVRHEPRHIGTSNYTFRKLLIHALNMVTGFSTLPLQFASMVGFAFTLLGLLVLVYVVGRYFIQGSVPGFPFLASIVAIFSGAQLFALGIFGEYLARVHFRLMDKPAYTIRNSITGDDRHHV
jgi:glycosyltransferase involved in cell wall biosynthesis